MLELSIENVNVCFVLMIEHWEVAVLFCFFIIFI